MRVEQTRDNVFTVTATGQELSALIAAARMSLEALKRAPDAAPAEALSLLEQVLRDFDAARERGPGPS